MNSIIPISKYNLSSKKFDKKVLKKDKPKSLSYVYDKIIYEENDNSYEYIIFANGNRAKDISKDGEHPYGRRDYVGRIKEYFNTKKKNIIIVHILVDNDAPLNLEAQIIANYIDRISQCKNTNSISLIGHSKCGAMFFNTPKYFKQESSFEKTHIYTSATPYQGCLIATPKLFLKQVKNVIDIQLPFPLNILTYNALEMYYSSISSNSHMDNDIALPGYVTDNYDPQFIAKMFDEENIRAIKKVHGFYNIITGIDDETIYKYLERKDFTSVGMCLMDLFFMEETTDGFIEVKSQESVSKHLDANSIRINSTSHYYLAHNDELGIVLDIVNENIDKYNEEKNDKRLSKKIS